MTSIKNLLIAKIRNLTRPANDFQAMDRRLDKLGQELHLLRDQIAIETAEIKSNMPTAEETRRLRRDIGKLRELIKDSENTNYQQISQYIELRHRISASKPIPPLRSWAASPDLLIVLMDLLQQRQPKKILELGSGASSLVITRYAHSVGATVSSFDHERSFGDATQRLVDEWGYSSCFELFITPLRDNGGLPFYDRTAIGLDVPKFDFVVIDGPPASVGATARGGLLPGWRDLLTEDCLILLDDYRRDGEREVVKQWLDAGHVTVVKIYDRLEKQAALLQLAK